MDAATFAACRRLRNPDGAPMFIRWEGGTHIASHHYAVMGLPVAVDENTPRPVLVTRRS